MSQEITLKENYNMPAPNPTTTSLNAENPLSSKEYIAKLRRIFDKYTSTKFFSMVDACINCGKCAKACHYYCSEKAPEHIPANRIKILKKIISQYFHPIKSKLGLSINKDPMTSPDFDLLYKAAFENCTICGNCALTCPMGINTGEIMYMARALLFGLGRLPSGLIDPVNTTLETGNYLGLQTS